MLKQRSFCTDNFWCFFKQLHLAKLHQNMVLGAKAALKNMQQHFSAVVGESEKHLLCCLLNTNAFAICKWN
jgi:hypothetical protein